MQRNANQHNANLHNPFRYGTVVDEPFFINRVNELDEIKRSLLSGQNLIIYAPRRYGKTSLIKKVIKDLTEENHPFIYIDFFKIHSKEKLIEEYGKEIFRNYKSCEKTLKRVSQLVKSLRPVLTVNEKGIPEFTVKFERERITEALDDVLNLPERLAESKRWIVVFDEFQEIERLNGENFEKELRAAFQHHTQVSYVFMGSRKHLITNIFTRKNRAFYNFGRLFRVDKLPSDEFRNYIKQGFTGSGTDITKDLIDEILETAGNIPFYIQMLASVLWDQKSGKKNIVTIEDFDQALETVLWHQSDLYLHIIQELTAYQQKVLQALAVENSGIFTSEYAQRHSLSAVSSTQKAIKRLEDKDIINKSASSYHFEDPIFRLWLLRNCR